MKIKKHILLIWAIGLLSIGILLVATVLDGFQMDPDIFIPFGIAYTIVGGLIAARHPENAIGWLILAGLFTISTNELMLWYAKIGLQTQPGAFPLVNISAALTNALENIGYALLLIFPFLLFPNGRLLSQRWLPILWLAVFTQLMQFFEIFRPGPLVNLTNWENPLGIEGMAGYFEMSGTLIEILTATLFFICTMLLILRYRHATIIERQQIKWFAFVGSVVSFSLILSIFIFDTLGDVEIVIGLSIFTSLLLAFAIAILRYNLWDIDLIIRRTLQYAMLTGLLAFVYIGSVLVLQIFVETITGEQSPLVIVFSTLAIAALFNPLRHRIQNFIDRRFFRSKYDAAQTLARFASVARNEVDMETLITSIFAMVNETVHPKNISLWLKNYEDT